METIQVCSLGSEVARSTNRCSQRASTGSFDKALTKMLKPALELPGANSLPGFFCCRFERACAHALASDGTVYYTPSVTLRECSVHQLCHMLSSALMHVR